VTFPAVAQANRGIHVFVGIENHAMMLGLASRGFAGSFPRNTPVTRVLITAVQGIVRESQNSAESEIHEWGRHG